MKGRISGQDYRFGRDSYLRDSFKKNDNYKIDFFSFKDTSSPYRLDAKKFSNMVDRLEERKPSYLPISRMKSAQESTTPRQSKYSQQKPRLQMGKKLLLLDLDETLVHSSTKPFYPSSDLTIRIAVKNRINNVYVLVRPHMEQFLQRMAKTFDLGVYTAGTQIYASAVMDRIDKFGLIRTKFYRHNCKQTPSGFVKNLELAGRNLQDVILLDNNPVSYANHKENGIHIKSWYGNRSDKELLTYCDLLEKVATYDDTRAGIAKVFGKPVIYEPVSSKINSFDFSKRIFSPKSGRNLNSSFDMSSSDSSLNMSLNSVDRSFSRDEKKRVKSNNYLNLDSSFTEKKGYKPKENRSFIVDSFKNKTTYRYDNKDLSDYVKSALLSRKRSLFKAKFFLRHLSQQTRE